jgi:hypothetical protein
MVSSWFDTNSKEKTSKVTVLGEQGQGVGESERRDVRPLHQSELIKQVGEAVKLGSGVVKPPELEKLPVLAPLTSMDCDNELPSTSEPEDDEQLIDYSSSRKCMSVEDNGEDTTDFNENRPYDKADDAKCLSHLFVQRKQSA